MNILEHHRTQNWLKQFKNSNDYLLAALFLRSLKLVSFAEFEGAITEQITSIPKDVKSRTALFPVVRQDAADFLPDSSGRIRHMFKNLYRQDKRRFCIEPSFESMRAQKVKNIVLVDDIVGSGKRLDGYLKTAITPTIKSWLSYKLCKIFIVSYAITTEGEAFVRRRHKYLKQENFISVMNRDGLFQFGNKDLVDLLTRYGSRASGPTMYLGFKGVHTNIVFQHGAPNNLPGILVKDSKEWMALFTDRAIPKDMYPLFESKKSFWDIFRLKTVNVQKYSELLDDFRKIEEIDKLNLISVLNLLTKGYKLKKALHIGNFTSSQVENIQTKL
ncbi:phosphoribosyltransferase-like protein [Turneriella parva]|uniref:PRTase-CE domain-containing protein n=1 Tax=Turneriella parva (strain ATCC BAA-1111 / DSM 21527 / NCTC 11395 / H) TaxID=869212 RepID=I4BA00_TURPD|nr:hypothetical protein [Turneriella parva]AFM14107.1 hypothetical protein Turpa_3470 [Turneriella parva DSM 21527]